jgi:hypothetical protein
MAHEWSNPSRSPASRTARFAAWRRAQARAKLGEQLFVINAGVELDVGYFW